MAAPAPQARKDLSMAGLLATERRAFIIVPDTRRQASVKYSMTDPLFSSGNVFTQVQFAAVFR